MKLTLNKLIFFLTFLVFLTSSFDIFLNLKLGGFSIRFTLVIMIIQILFFLAQLILTEFKKPIRFLGFYPFMIWFVFLILFIPNTTILSRNIGYMLWLSIFTLFIMLLPSFINTEKEFIKLIRLYLLTFTLVAAFGLFQFGLGLIGYDLLVEQWWLDGKLPRINAFSYEPSYFTTYVFIGWVVLFFLIISGSKLAGAVYAKTYLFLISLSLLLSTSRMGLALMFLILIVYLANQILTAIISLKIKKRIFPVFIALFTFIFMCISYIILYFDKISFMLNGLGVYGYASHSSGQRISELRDTWNAFLQSPFIGYSLGGIPPAIANVRGTTIGTQLDAKEFEGMNIFAETLAASGIFGFIFFISFLLLLFYKCHKLQKSLIKVNPDFAHLLFALVMGLFFELVLLSMNQNILRTYLWVHIGIVNLAYFVGKEILRKHEANVLRVN